MELGSSVMVNVPAPCFISEELDIVQLHELLAFIAAPDAELCPWKARR